MKQGIHDPENTRKLLEQHWFHCRHLESERAWFIKLYAVITAGVLFFEAQQGSRTQWPLYFLIILTFFGFFLTIRWTHAFESHRDKVNNFAKIIGLGSKIDPTMDIPSMEIPLPKKLGKVKEAFRTRFWFPAFYLSVLVLLAILLPSPPQWVAIGCLGIAVPLQIGFVHSLRKIKEQEHSP